MSERDTRRGAALRRAMELVTEALDLLDAHGGPPDAAAYLALGQQQLRQQLASDAPA